MSLLPAYMSELWKCYEEMRRVDMLVLDPSLVSTNPLTCHISVLPFLAWEADVNIDGFSEELQRSLIDGAFRSLQYAGTKAALENALDAIVDVDVVEWFSDAADPYTFKLELSVDKDVEITPGVANRVEAIANKRKNARSTMSEILLSYKVSSNSSLISGGVGESSCEAIPLDGYEEILSGRQHIYIGNVGEVSSYAEMEVL